MIVEVLSHVIEYTSGVANLKNIYGNMANKYSYNALLEQTVANILDVVAAVITITIQYPYVDAIMC